MNFETRLSRQADDTAYFSDAERTAKSNRRKIIIGAILVVLVVAAAYFLFGRKTAEPVSNGGKTAAGAQTGDKQAPSVSVMVPGHSIVPTVVSATGTLAARREMPVGVAGEGGVITHVWVEPGSWVRAGQVLASIERSVQSQESGQIAAQINAAQADARLAQSELARSATLVSRGFISKADLDRKTAARDSANARVRIAQAQFGANRARIGRLDIRSPAAGLVLTRAIEPGQVVSAGSGVLFRIARGGEMELRAQLGEVDLARMTVGVNAQVTPVGTTTPFTGQIWQISPVIDPQSRQGTARIALAYNRALRPGGFASATITSGMVDAPLLPDSAVLNDSKGNYVYVVGANNKVERREVTVGSVSDAGISILAGISGQELVISSAGAFLNPGETINPSRITAK
jgi:HlyD family secretion protein